MCCRRLRIWTVIKTALRVSQFEFKYEDDDNHSCYYRLYRLHLCLINTVFLRILHTFISKYFAKHMRLHRPLVQQYFIPYRTFMQHF